MKKASLISMVVVLAGAATAFAQPGNGEQPRGRHGHGAQRFEKMDTNGDGKISREEMLAHRDARFTKLDANGDGTITKEEREERRAERAQAHFQKRDKNGDGKITRDEAPRMKPEKFEKKDLDGDGAISESEMQAAMAKRGHKKHKRFGKMEGKSFTRDAMQQHAAKHFDKLDQNADGFLTPDELKKGHGKHRRGKGHGKGRGMGKRAASPNQQ